MHLVCALFRMPLTKPTLNRKYALISRMCLTMCEYDIPQRKKYPSNETKEYKRNFTLDGDVAAVAE